MNKKTTLVMLTLLVGMVSAFPMVKAQTVVEPFIYGTRSNPSSFDPLGAYDTTSGHVILNTLEGLYSFDYFAEAGLGVQPQLASAMGTWNEEMDVLTIPLRSDVTWWDGTAFTAADVVWNFERLNRLSLANVNEHGSLWLTADGETILESIEATGTYEVEMTLGEFTGAWEKLLPFWGASLIKPIATLVGAAENDTISLEDFDQIIGTGPFKTTAYAPSDTTTLERYVDYYMGCADIAKIEFQYYADAGTLTDAVLAEEVHVVRSILDASLNEAFQNPNIHVELLRGSCCYFYHMHVGNIPREVRKAAQFAFNYSYLPANYLTLPSHVSPVPAGMEGYNPDLPGLPYLDLDMAREWILDSTDPTIVAGLAANSLDEDSEDADWIAAALSETPVAAYNFTHYGTGFYTFLRNGLQFVGIQLVSHIVGDWPTFLDYMHDPANIATVQFAMGGWCPDYFDPINMLEPLFATTGSSNWNGLNNATINANLAAIHTMADGSDEKLDAVDEVITQIIVEQAAALYCVSSADLIAWNINPNHGILGGAEVLLNVRGDKFFYPIDFALSEPIGGTGPTDDDTDDDTTGGIPGFDLGLLMVASLGAAALLIIRKRK
jgi:ABC-type transport system substrate-binding protein